MFGLTPYRRNNEAARRNGNVFDVDSVFENFFNDAFFPSFYSTSSYMKVDIKESEKEYVVDAELPGITKDEINLEVHDDVLTIAVNRKEEVNEEKDSYIRKERRSYAMCRSFQLDNIKNEDITAKYENGILSISLPKQEPDKVTTHKIDIQ